MINDVQPATENELCIDSAKTPTVAISTFAVEFYKCKKNLTVHNSLKQCLTATRPRSHN